MWSKSVLCENRGLWLKSSMITFLLLLVTFGRDYITKQQIQKKPSGKPHGSDFPFPCPLCHRFPQRLCITVWLPTASDLVRLKSFFKQQAAFKDLVEGEMMLGRTAKLRQRNVFQTGERMLEIPWGPVLWHSYTIADKFSKLWVRWVPLASLAQTSCAKQGCLPVCVCTGLPGHLLRA